MATFTNNLFVLGGANSNNWARKEPASSVDSAFAGGTVIYAEDENILSRNSSLGVKLLYDAIGTTNTLPQDFTLSHQSAYDNTAKAAVKNVLDTYVNNMVHATYSTGLAGGAAKKIPYQTAANTTSFVDAPTSGNQVLQSNAANTGFTWATISSLDVENAANADVATSISGGSANQLLYQSAANTTATLAAPGNSKMLVSTSSGALSWLTQSDFVADTATKSLSVNSSWELISSYYYHCYANTTGLTLSRASTSTGSGATTLAKFARDGVIMPTAAYGTSAPGTAVSNPVEGQIYFKIVS